MDQQELERRFTYHAPHGDQADRYQTIRAYALSFAMLINKLAPDSREKSLAITNLEDVVMRVNQAIACNEVDQAHYLTTKEWERRKAEGSRSPSEIQNAPTTTGQQLDFSHLPPEVVRGFYPGEDPSALIDYLKHGKPKK